MSWLVVCQHITGADGGCSSPTHLNASFSPNTVISAPVSHVVSVYVPFRIQLRFQWAGSRQPPPPAPETVPMFPWPRIDCHIKWSGFKVSHLVISGRYHLALCFTCALPNSELRITLEIRWVGLDRVSGLQGKYGRWCHFLLPPPTLRCPHPPTYFSIWENQSRSSWTSLYQRCS